MKKALAIAILLGTLAVFAATTVDLTTDVRGILPTANGGTGNSAGTANVTTYTVATLPASPSTGEIAPISDGTSSTDCTVGGGTTPVLCQYNGTAWAAVSGGGGGTPGGASGSIQYNNAGAFGGFGNWDGTTFSTGGSGASVLGITSTTIAGLSSLTGLTANVSEVEVSDGNTCGDTTTGGGSIIEKLKYLGSSAWEVVSCGPPGVSTSGAWSNITGSVTVSGCTVSGGVCTVGTATHTVTFSSIPGTYNTMVIQMQLRADDATTVAQSGMTINGDTGANYDRVYAGSAGGSLAAQSNALTGGMPAASASVGLTSFLEWTFPNYAATAFDKIMIGRHVQFATLGTTGTYLNYIDSALWRSTAAITQIQFIDTTGGNFAVGSTFAIYGVK